MLISAAQTLLQPFSAMKSARNRVNRGARTIAVAVNRADRFSSEAG